MIKEAKRLYHRQSEPTQALAATNTNDERSYNGSHLGCVDKLRSIAQSVRVRLHAEEVVA
jgi:hypothetical protein